MARRSQIPDKIISILVEKPTITREEISEQLGVSYQSVQKHLLQLQKQKVVLPSFTVTEKQISKYTFWIFIMTKNPREGRANRSENDYQRTLCKEIAQSFHQPELKHLVEGLIYGGVNIIIGGRYDIILRLYSDTPNSVGSYVTRFLRGHAAISSTSTAWSLAESSIATDRE